jgi:hypothetical protein
MHITVHVVGIMPTLLKLFVLIPFSYVPQKLPKGQIVSVWDMLYQVFLTNLNVG